MHTTVVPDGSMDFAGGVDAQAIKAVRSEIIPHGLRRDQLAWLNNATVRNGCITQRAGWHKLSDLHNGGLFQGGIMYEPINSDDHPFLIVSIAGQIYKALLDAPYTVTNLSAVFGLSNPPTQEKSFFCEGEGFLVIQAGDGVTKPLFYASATATTPEFMRRSNGITGNLATSELPAATAMVYYGNRIWYAQNRTWTAGDISGNQTSGTAPFNFKDSVLRVTENPLAFGGDGFTLPSQAGNIRALAYTANLDTQLGQGPLYIFTRKQVYAMVVPVTRANWVAATNNNGPVVTVAQINNGTSSDRTVVHINGDLFYQSFDPAIRSLIVATRFYKQWGNVQISNNVNRALQANNRALMKFASATEFDNRLLQGVGPKQTPFGVVCPGLIPLNFDLVSTLQEQASPAWEGVLDGLDHFELFTGDFGGLPRCVTVILDRQDMTIDIWEITQAERFDDGGTPATTQKRVTWQAEFPAFTWGKEFEIKKLHGGEIWFDKVVGTVNLEVWYRPDADPCWHLWTRTSFCAAKNCDEDLDHPICYPLSPDFREGYRFPIVLPAPPIDCDSIGIRPSDQGYMHQPKIVVTGYARVRGIILYSEIRERQLYEGLICG